MTHMTPPALRGSTKIFFPDENIDHLLAMVMTLGAEISQLADKLDTVVRLLERRQPIDQARIAAFEPNAQEQAARDASRTVFIETLLAPFQQAADALTARAAAKRA